MKWEQCSSNWYYAKTLRGTQGHGQFQRNQCPMHFHRSSYLNMICLKVHSGQESALASLVHLLFILAIFHISLSRIAWTIIRPMLGTNLSSLQTWSPKAPQSQTWTQKTVLNWNFIVSYYTPRKKLNFWKKFMRSLFPYLSLCSKLYHYFLIHFTFPHLVLGHPGLPTCNALNHPSLWWEFPPSPPGMEILPQLHVVSFWNSLCSLYGGWEGRLLFDAGWYHRDIYR